MLSFPNRCQHIKVNGTQCGCPALRRNKLCYFHKRHHEERIELNLDRLKNDRAKEARRRSTTIELPVLEDANSIQVSLMQIMRLVAAGRIELKAAGLMLYALQTASSNLSRTSFEPHMHNVVLDPRAVDETPLGAFIWDDSDFRTADGDENDEAERAAALEEAQRKAKKKEELQRWAEAEVNRLIAQGIHERETARQAQAAARAHEAEREAQSQNEEERRLTTNASPENAILTAAITPTGHAVVLPTQAEPSPARRPPANAKIDELRKQVRDQFRKALPAIAAAHSARNRAEGRVVAHSPLILGRTDDSTPVT
jgi:hypothetical protein